MAVFKELCSVAKTLMTAGCGDFNVSVCAAVAVFVCVNGWVVQGPQPLGGTLANACEEANV